MQPTSIRLDEELYTKIKELRTEEDRSISGEIVHILKQYFKNKD